MPLRRYRELLEYYVSYRKAEAKAYEGTSEDELDLTPDLESE